MRFTIVDEKLPRCVASCVLVMLVSVTLTAAEAAPPSPMAQAKAAVAKAAAEEAAVQKEWNSREMARSATREICRSERARAELALQKVLAAQEEVRTKVSTDGKRLQQALTTMRAVAERLLDDSRAADRAARELIVVENKLRDKMAATRAAQRVVLELGAKAAEKSKAQAARRAVYEADAVAAWEIQLWAGVQKNTAGQIVEQAGHACQIATKMAAAETDPASKKLLQKFAAEEVRAKAAAVKLIAEKNAQIDAAAARIYPLRVAAIGALKPLSPDAWNYAKARHLLVRAGFGGTPQEVEKLRAMGLYKAVDYLVDFHRRPSAQATLDFTPPLPADPLEAKLRNSFVRSQATAARRSIDGGQQAKLRQWWLKRMVNSPRPLQEKLTLFWHGHFASQQSVVRNSFTLYHQNQLFREHAAGSFSGLLYGIIHDPVMIRFLDNNKNVKGHPNENLAREIMELFAMGEDQGYTEADIREAARALTGYAFDHHTGQFRYFRDKHDTGEKTIFGRKGNWSGDDVVRLILEQPATARFISRRLFEFFAHNQPSSETIDRLATVLRGGKYELRPLLKNLFLSEEFYSPQATGTQIKSPVQLTVGMLRDLGVKQATNYGQVDGMIQNMGQVLFEPPDVKGWRRGRSWISASRVFIRYNSAAKLVQTSGLDVVGLLEGRRCSTAADVVDQLAKTCFAKPLNDQQRAKLIEFLGPLPPPAQWANSRDEINVRLRALLVLMISTPEYQMT